MDWKNGMKVQILQEEWTAFNDWIDRGWRRDNIYVILEPWIWIIGGNIMFNGNGEVGRRLDLRLDDNVQDFVYAELEW